MPFFHPPSLPDLIEELTAPPPWLVAAFAALLAAGLFLTGLGNHALWDYHEPYVGGIIHEMATRGAWVVPTLNGQPYLEKPPLFYLMGVFSCRAAGSFEPWALRLPSALMAIATVAWTTWLGCRLRSTRAGLLAGGLVATNALFFQMGHRAVVDMTLTATVTLALGLALLALEEAGRRLWVELFWASLGLVFLAKGLVGPVLVLVPLGVVLALDRRDPRRFLRPGWGLALGLALAAAWVVPLALAGGREFLTEVFLRNTLGRFLEQPGLVPRTGSLDEHREPLLFYLTRTPGNVLPWLALWLASLAAPAFRPHRRRVLDWAVPVLFLAVLVLLSLSAGKRMVYLLPVLPITFLHTALWTDGAFRDRPGLWGRGALRLSLTFALALGCGLPWFAHLRAGLPWPWALAMSLAALVPGAFALLEARPGRALAWGLVQWGVSLVAFLVLAVPALDREWNPILEPFQTAKDLEHQGAQVSQGRLTETQLGFVNLTFGHTLSAVDTPEAVRAALARPGPVALLLEPKFYWRRELRLGVAGGAEIPTEASASRRLWDRAPALVVNPAALALLGAGPASEDP